MRLAMRMITHMRYFVVAFLHAMNGCTFNLVACPKLLLALATLLSCRGCLVEVFNREVIPTSGFQVVHRFRVITRRLVIFLAAIILFFARASPFFATASLHFTWGF